MDTFHNKLMHHFSWYAAYHKKSNYRKLNLVIFALIAGPLVILAVTLTQPELVEFMFSSAAGGGYSCSTSNTMSSCNILAFFGVPSPETCTEEEACFLERVFPQKA